MNAAPTHDSVVAKIHRVLHLGYSYCLRCGFTWQRVTPHETPYGGIDWESWVGTAPDGEQFPVGFSQACFALCERCWDQTTIDERVEYYLTMMSEWSECPPEKAEAILDAVRHGL